MPHESCHLSLALSKTIIIFGYTCNMGLMIVCKADRDQIKTKPLSPKKAATAALNFPKRQVFDLGLRLGFGAVLG